MTHTIVRRLILTVVAAGIALGFSGQAAAKGKTFALVLINQQALFFNQINNGAETAAAETGNKLVTFNSNNDPAQQNTAIENYIQQKVDGIVVNAIDVNGVMPAVEQADKAGIPVIGIDAILPKGPQKAQVGVDNAKAGADLADFFLDYVAKNMGGSAKLGIIGALNSYTQNIRQKGFEDKVRGSDKVEIADVVDGQNVQDIALSAAENLITANPDLTAIYATGEPALLGAIAAVESQGKQGSIKIFGWDLTAEAIRGIDDGYVVGVVQQDPTKEGQEAVKALDTLSSGGSVDRNIDVPITIVTKDNVESYRETFK